MTLDYILTQKQLKWIDIRYSNYVIQYVDLYSLSTFSRHSVYRRGLRLLLIYLKKKFTIYLWKVIVCIAIVQYIPFSFTFSFFCHLTKKHACKMALWGTVCMNLVEQAMNSRHVLVERSLRYDDARPQSSPRAGRHFRLAKIIVVDRRW